MATHSSTLAWKIPWTEEPGGLQSTGHTESDMTEATQQQLGSSSKGSPPSGLRVSVCLYTFMYLEFVNWLICTYFSVVSCSDLSMLSLVTKDLNFQCTFHWSKFINGAVCGALTHLVKEADTFISDPSVGKQP